MEELDQELAGDVLLVQRESFNGNEDGGSGDDKDEKSMDSRCGEEAGLNGDRVGWGQVERFVRWSGWEIWHLYGGGFRCQ